MKLVDPSLPWYVVRCQPGREAKAWDELHAGGFDPYFPRRRRKKPVGRCRILREVEDAAMKGYIFLAGPVNWGKLYGNIDNRERQPVNVLGQVYMVPKGMVEPPHFEHVGQPVIGKDGPLLIPGKLVEKIQIDETNGEFDETGQAKLEKTFPKGMAIKVPSGALRGFPAIVECVTAKQRISALVSFLGRMVPMEFDPAQLEAAA